MLSFTGIQIQQRYILTLMMFFAILIGLSERSVLPIAITRMVAIPHQNDSTMPSTESYCTAPDWTVSNQTDSTTSVDQSVCGCIHIHISICLFIVDHSYSNTGSSMNGRKSNRA